MILIFGDFFSEKSYKEIIFVNFDLNLFLISNFLLKLAIHDLLN
jgi:hypothetical protein